MLLVNLIERLGEGEKERLAHYELQGTIYTLLLSFEAMGSS